MNTTRRNMVPSEGGWGWVVVFAVSVTNFLSRALDTSFGLLFGDLLRDLGLETTGAAILSSSLDAFNQFFGLLAGPAIQVFSYRKTAIFGSLLASTAMILCYFARSMLHLFITYSFLLGVGLSFTHASGMVVINYYFTKRRGRAMALSVMGGALAVMVLPHLVRFLVEQYGFRGGVLILGSILLNTVVSSSLLQPAEWHYIPDGTSYFITREENGLYNNIPHPEQKFEHNEETNWTDPHSHLIVAADKEASLPSNRSSISESYINLDVEAHKRACVYSTNSRTTGSSDTIYYDALPQNDVSDAQENNTYNAFSNGNQDTYQLPSSPIQQTKEKNVAVWIKIIRFFNLDLLKNPIYINMSVGLSLFYVADQNFKMVVPFFFESIKFTKTDIASFLTFQGLGDIVSRLITALISDKVPVTKRTIFLVSTFCLVISRTVLATQTDYTCIVVCLAIGGMFRGVCFSVINLTISEHFALEKLAGAYGLQMVIKGTCSIIIGPIIGYIRDTTTSYTLCIHLQTSLVLFASVAWTLEYIVCRLRTKTSLKR